MCWRVRVTLFISPGQILVFHVMLSMGIAPNWCDTSSQSLSMECCTLENGQYWDTNVMYFFSGQCGPGRADVLIVLSPHGWQAHHHHDQSQKSQSHGHHWSFRWVLIECSVPVKGWYSRLYTWSVSCFVCLFRGFPCRHVIASKLNLPHVASLQIRMWRCRWCVTAGG